MVIAPDGKVLYQKEGKLDILEMRRAILANMPDTKVVLRAAGVLAGGRR